jgi:hypothetical protein
MTLKPTAAAVADATATAARRGDPLGRLATTPVLLRDIEWLFLPGW